MDMHIASGAEGGTSALQFERKILFGVLLTPMLAPLKSAFGEYGDLAATEFAQALSRIEDAPHG
jgi:hypothetical protein